MSTNTRHSMPATVDSLGQPSEVGNRGSPWWRRDSIDVLPTGHTNVDYPARPGTPSSAQDRSKTTRFMSKILGINNRPGTPQNIAGEKEVLERNAIIGIVGRVTEEVKRAFVVDAVGQFPVPQTNSQVCHAIYSDTNIAKKIVLVYSSETGRQKLTDELHILAGSHTRGDKDKLSGLIYLDDASVERASGKSVVPLNFLDKYVERSNVVLATIGWDDDRSSEHLVNRQKELREQWKPFVDRGVSVLRLSAPGKHSQDVFHTPLDIVKLVTSKFDAGPSTKRSTWKGRGNTPDDLFLEDPMDTDVIIPVMGPTGSGKSTLINTIVGHEITTVGHDLRSQTAQLHHVILRHPHDNTRRIIIVDTPGFDDTYVSDSEILRRIAVWLARSYSANMKLAGVIYLHEISQTRMLGTARKNLDMFNKLIGEDATSSIVLATTKWSDIPEEVGERREEQLRDRHWKWMFDLGAKLGRFTGTSESGWNLLNLILDMSGKSNVDSVEIQKELVEIKKILPDTQAGQTLRYTLEELLETQRIAAAQLRNDGDSEEAKKMMQETQTLIRATTKQINELSGPLAHRLVNWIRRLSPSST